MPALQSGFPWIRMVMADAGYESRKLARELKRRHGWRLHYAPEGKAEDMWSQYHGTQPGDPAKLGDALVKIAAMQNTPKLFVAGSDAVSTITPAIEERLREVRANEMLSKSTDGSF